jgi:hypothetical protein
MAHQPSHPVYSRIVGIPLAEPVAIYRLFLISFYRAACAEALKIGGTIEPPAENNFLCSIVRPMHFYCSSPDNPFLLVSA